MIDLDLRRQILPDAQTNTPSSASMPTQLLSANAAPVDMKTAVKTARAYIEEYFAGAKEILLEEVELQLGHYENNPVEGRSYRSDPRWRVVLSFKLGEPGALSEIMGGDPRLFREVLIERETGALHKLGHWEK